MRLRPYEEQCNPLSKVLSITPAILFMFSEQSTVKQRLKNHYSPGSYDCTIRLYVLLHFYKHTLLIYFSRICF